MKQRERLHAKALDDKLRRLDKLAADVAARSNQNQEVAVHLVTLGKVLEEQQRLQVGMHSSTEQAARSAEIGQYRAGLGVGLSCIGLCVGRRHSTWYEHIYVIDANVH